MRFGTIVMLAAALLAGRVAIACSVVRRCAMSAAPADGARIPANAPALVAESLFDPFDTPPAAFVDGTDVALDVVAESHGGGSQVFLRPTQPLEVGTLYRLEVSNHCEAAEENHVFMATAPATLPTDSGTASVTPTGFRDVSTGAPCSDLPSFDATLSIARVDVRIPEESRAFLPVARYEIEVDGHPWSTTGWGEITERMAKAGPVDVGELHAECKTIDSPPFIGLAPGRHLVRARLHVAGTDPADAALVETFLPCDGACGCASGGGSSVLLALAAVVARRRRR